MSENKDPNLPKMIKRKRSPSGDPKPKRTPLKHRKVLRSLPGHHSDLGPDELRLVASYLEMQEVLLIFLRLNSYFSRKVKDFLRQSKKLVLRIISCEIDSKSIRNLQSMLTGAPNLESLVLKSDQPINVMNGTLLEILEQPLASLRALEMDYSNEDYYSISRNFADFSSLLNRSNKI